VQSLTSLGGWDNFKPSFQLQVVTSHRQRGQLLRGTFGFILFIGGTLMLRYRSALAALLCAVLLAGQAVAAEVKFAFSGQVSGYLTASGTTMSTFPLGTLVSGVYGFNPATPDSNPSNGTGEYVNAVTSLSATIGASPVMSLNLSGFRDIAVFDNSFLGSDGYTLIADITGNPAPGFVANRIGINLLDGNTSTFTSDDLPLTPPLPGNFSSSFESQLILQSSAESVLFNITSLTLVPEPTGIVLLCSGILTLATIRRR
jgi:hypothetical protein